MVSGIHDIAIFVSAILSVAVASVWYSPLVFGSLWMQLNHTDKNNVQFSEKHMLRMAVIAVFVHTFFFGVIAWLTTIARLNGASLIQFCGALVSLVILSITNIILWEKKSLAYVLIHGGYLTLVIIGGVGVMTYWPW